LSPNRPVRDGDPVVAYGGGDEAAGEGVPVHRGHRRARVGEQPHVRRPVVAEPGRHARRVAGEQPEMLAEVQAGGEPRAGAGQHDGGLRVIALQSVERLVQVGEEGAVLRVDRVGRHRHHGDTTPPLDRPAHAHSSSRRRAS
jgi:hypothetical protein